WPRSGPRNALRPCTTGTARAGPTARTVSTWAASTRRDVRARRQLELFSHLGERLATLRRIGLHVRSERDHLHHAAVLLERHHLLVVHVSTDVGERAHAGMRRDDRRLAE